MTKNGRIIVTGSPDVLTNDLLGDLTRAGFEIDRLPEREPSIAQIRKKLPGAVGYLFGGFEFLDSETLSVADSLRVVSLLGEDAPGFLDLGKAKNLGIKVSNTPGATTQAVSEFVIAEIMANSRGLVDIFCPSKHDSEESSEEKVREISSQTVGIIGLGRIGKSIAGSLRRAFGTKVVYWNRTPRPEAEEALDIEYRDLKQLVQNSDVLVISIASHTDTELLLDRALLEQLKDGSSLFCISKSRVVDLVALIDQLRGGKVRSAWLDWVDKRFHAERSSVPEFEGLLRACPEGLRISGHVANDTIEAWSRMAKMASGSLRNLLVDGSDKFEVSF